MDCQYFFCCFSATPRKFTGCHTGNLCDIMENSPENLGKTLSPNVIHRFRLIPKDLFTGYPQPANPCAGCCFHTTKLEYLTNPCGYWLTDPWFFRYNPTIVSDDGYYRLSLSRLSLLIYILL